MQRAIAKWLAPAVALLMTACGTPETDCREGVREMKKRTETLVGFGQPADVRMALEEVSAAETQLATGNFEGCVESLGEARRYLRSSQRTNTQ